MTRKSCRAENTRAGNMRAGRERRLCSKVLLVLPITMKITVMRLVYPGAPIILRQIALDANVRPVAIVVHLHLHLHHLIRMHLIRMHLIRIRLILIILTLMLLQDTSSMSRMPMASKSLAQAQTARRKRYLTPKDRMMLCKSFLACVR